eukprot:9122049-Lingulodinium_polyedra.AAC.1
MCIRDRLRRCGAGSPRRAAGCRPPPRSRTSGPWRPPGQRAGRRSRPSGCAERWAALGAAH